jgi:hypothetical protein
LAFSKIYYQPQYELLPNFATTIMLCNYLEEWKVKKPNFILEKAMKSQRVSRGVALLFL